MKLRLIGFLVAVMLVTATFGATNASTRASAFTSGKDGSYNFTTTYSNPNGSGHRAGTMTLTVSSGSVSGTYRNASGAPTLVTGGLYFAKIWFITNISGTKERIDGSVSNGSITGTSNGKAHFTATLNN